MQYFALIYKSFIKPRKAVPKNETASLIASFRRGGLHFLVLLLLSEINTDR